MEDTTKLDYEKKAEAYATSKAFINPFDVYQAYIAGYQEALKSQSAECLKKNLEMKEKCEKKVSDDNQEIANLKKKLDDEKKKNKDKDKDHGNGNQGGGNGNGHGGGNGNH